MAYQLVDTYDGHIVHCVLFVSVCDLTRYYDQVASI